MSAETRADTCNRSHAVVFVKATIVAFIAVSLDRFASFDDSPLSSFWVEH